MNSMFTFKHFFKKFFLYQNAKLAALALNLIDKYARLREDKKGFIDNKSMTLKVGRKI